VVEELWPKNRPRNLLGRVVAVFAFLMNKFFLSIFWLEIWWDVAKHPNTTFLQVWWGSLVLAGGLNLKKNEISGFCL